MENHHHDHETPQPSNKWIATPILLAVFVIALVATFLSMKSNTCCEGSCKEKANTEQHGNDHGTTDEHATTSEHSESATNDSTKTTSDSTSTTNEPAKHEGHGEGDGHGH